jgi:hypothetical protein
MGAEKEVPALPKRVEASAARSRSHDARSTFMLQLRMLQLRIEATCFFHLPCIKSGAAIQTATAIMVMPTSTAV